jgi:hypothetical protein
MAGDLDFGAGPLGDFGADSGVMSVVPSRK